MKSALMEQNTSSSRESRMKRIFLYIKAELYSRKAVYGIATLVFLFHFWASWNFSDQYVHRDIIKIVIEPFRLILEQGIVEAITERRFQTNSYTGSPFFMYPFILVLGLSPQTILLILTTITALSTMFFFLVYYELFDLKKAVLGVLILFSMNNYILFRHIDYNYTLFFSSLITLLYFKWISGKENRFRTGWKLQRSYLYLLGFFSGLFFYFKATIAYLLISLSIDALYRQGIGIVRDIDVPLIVLFLIGIAPFLAFSLVHFDVVMKNSPGSPTAQSDPVLPDELNLLETRLKHLDTFIAPQNAMVGDLRVSKGLIGLDLHLFTFILITLLPGLFIWREHLDIGLMLVSMFVLFFMIPESSGLRSKQLTFIVPFIPLVFLSVIDEIPGKLEDMLTGLLCLFFLVLVVNTYSGLYFGDTSVDRDSIDYRHWGGDQETHVQFEEHDLKGPVLTNSYIVYMYSRYNLQAPSAVFLVSRQHSDVRDYGSLHYSGAHPAPLLQMYQLGEPEYNPPRLKNELEYEEPVNIVLREELPCKPEREEFCGGYAETVIEDLDIDETELERVTVNSQSYLIAENLDPERLEGIERQETKTLRPD